MASASFFFEPTTTASTSMAPTSTAAMSDQTAAATPRVDGVSWNWFNEHQGIASPLTYMLLVYCFVSLFLFIVMVHTRILGLDLNLNLPSRPRPRRALRRTRSRSRESVAITEIGDSDRDVDVNWETMRQLEGDPPISERQLRQQRAVLNRMEYPARTDSRRPAPTLGSPEHLRQVQREEDRIIRNLRQFGLM